MKTKIFTSVLFLALMLVFNGCQAKVNNSISFKNLTSSTVYVNFRGTALTVLAGNTQTISEIPKGEYEYGTTYQLPAGTTSSTTQGPVSGTVKINAGTRVMLIYSSSFLNGSYVFSASISSNDEITGTTNP